MLDHEKSFQLSSQCIPAKEIKYLLCSAFEGGSNSWYMIDRIVYPEGTSGKDFSEGGRMQDAETYWHWCQLVPLCLGGALIISSKDDDEINGAKQWTLDRTALQKGLDLMRDKFPRHWADFVGDNADAETGDVFLQLSLFGEIVYG